MQNKCLTVQAKIKEAHSVRHIAYIRGKMQALWSK
jgi:hypothetical protein